MKLLILVIHDFTDWVVIVWKEIWNRFGGRVGLAVAKDTTPEFTNFVSISEDSFCRRYSDGYNCK